MATADRKPWTGAEEGWVRLTKYLADQLPTPAPHPETGEVYSDSFFRFVPVGAYFRAKTAEGEPSVLYKKESDSEAKLAKSPDEDACQISAGDPVLVLRDAPDLS